jgi:hypothetical protein
MLHRQPEECHTPIVDRALPAASILGIVGDRAGGWVWMILFRQ